jgi:hypothetical protein
MGDVTMFRRLCEADFGHAMSALHCRWPKVWQISARAKPKPSLIAVSTSHMTRLPIPENLWTKFLLRTYDILEFFARNVLIEFLPLQQFFTGALSHIS